MSASDELNVLESSVTSPNKEWWLWLSAALFFGLLLFGGYEWRLMQLQQNEERASAAYVTAVTTEEKFKVAQAHLGTRQSAAWLLQIANAFYTQTNYTQAEAAFRLAAEKHPTHPLHAGAWLGQANALKALGQVEAATALYQKIIADKERNAYQPLAALELARLQIDQKKLPEARQTLTDFNARFSQTPFAGEAKLLLNTLP